MMRRSVVAILLLLMPVGALAAEGASLGGTFRLIDQTGTVRTEADFRGSYPLIYFGFTHCPDLCPRSLGTMSTALDELSARAPAKAQRVALLFITIDPERDSVAVMKDYVAKFHPRLIGLTGSAEEVEGMTRNYGAFFAPVPQEGGGYAMDHSGFIVLMGPAGEYLTHFESDVGADALAAELEQRVAP
jgi:cytochrome oxidase Cu insertion factor (SCO1/SenC/PrrC family)